eukprot:887277-Prorocentrum_minimum.AAC.4
MTHHVEGDPSLVQGTPVCIAPSKIVVRTSCNLVQATLCVFLLVTHLIVIALSDAEFEIGNDTILQHRRPL